ncbi:MAG: hypothetical protein KBT11_07805 [Treponema sp.]|nr:hypothetical protein [Candidatus Treponema equifaecale]
MAGVFFASCSSKDGSLNFMSAMETVDIYLKNGEVNDALRLLKKSEKNAFSAYARLGIYKRYLRMGEEKLAEKTLQKAWKKLPENPEIAVVYGNNLLKAGKYSEALNVTSCLTGTKYGSIHSEVLLKSVLDRENIRAEDGPLFKKEISSAYYDVYAGTDDARWLRNCALIYLMGGDYVTAAGLQPEKCEDSEDALFWGYVQYDSGNYDVAVRNLKNVKSDLLAGAGAMLASDAYMMLDDEDESEEAREDFIGSAKSYSKISPALSVNSALWAFRHDDLKRAYELLVNAIIDNPEYTPGLVSYGKMAWADSRPRNWSDLELSLRKTNLRTEKMREFDERPKFTVEDAIFRMDEELERQSLSGKIRSDELIVERLDLFLKSREDLPLKQRTALIWNELEKNELGKNIYPGHLVQFAVQKFLSYGLGNEARQLFTNYVTQKFSLNYEEQQGVAGEKIVSDIFGGQKKEIVPVVPEFIAKLAFGERAAMVADRMEIWEVEFAAYFALLDDNIAAAKRLYEYVNFETGGAKTANASGDMISVSPLAAPSSSANLAMIYSSSGEKKKALNLYSLAAGRTSSKRTKSKLLYRVALLQFGLGHKQDAKTSAAYAVSLDQSNADARLLQRQLDVK